MAKYVQRQAENENYVFSSSHAQSFLYKNKAKSLCLDFHVSIVTH